MKHYSLPEEQWQMAYSLCESATHEMEGPSLSFDSLQDQVVSEKPLRSLGAHAAFISGDLPPSPAESMNSDDFIPRESRMGQRYERKALIDSPILRIKTPEQQDMSKRRSQYYDGVFAPKGPNTTARDRVLRESVIIADVRTNVIVKDEFSILTDLSYQLSIRYQRPESCILVNLTHSSCLLLGGSWDPAYILTITAVPSQMQPVTNKRNAALLQTHLEESLGVPAARGIIKFMPIPEENFAINGKTVLGEIEDLEKDLATESAVIQSRSVSRCEDTLKAKKRQSLLSLRGFGKSKETARVTPTPTEGYNRPASPQPPPISFDKKIMEVQSEKAQKMARRRSFMTGLFGRG